MIFPKSINTPASLTVHVFTLTAFLLMCILLYEPKTFCDLLHAGEGVSRISSIYPFNISIVCAITLGSVLICRLLLMLCKRWVNFSLQYYILWCIGEILFISAFIALYLVLMARGQENYFYYLGNCFSSLLTLLVYPYIIIAQFYYAHDLPKQFMHEDDLRLRFYDNRRLLKLTTTAASILYIQASENYLDIYYLENGKIRSYELRNSMKNIEDLCQKAGFVRTHRSYIVNPANVKMVAKGEEGRYYAKLAVPDSPEIPVTKKNYESLLNLL